MTSNFLPRVRENRGEKELIKNRMRARAALLWPKRRLVKCWENCAEQEFLRGDHFCSVVIGEFKDIYNNENKIACQNKK